MATNTLEKITVNSNELEICDAIARNGGFHAFSINSDGHLICEYNSANAPAYSINSAGHLILTTTGGQTVDLGQVVGGGGTEVTVSGQPIPFNLGGVAFSFGASDTFAFTGTWPNGQAVFIHGTVAAGASIASNITVLGYGSIPTDQAFQASAWCVNGAFFVNVISTIQTQTRTATLTASNATTSSKRKTTSKSKTTT